VRALAGTAQSPGLDAATGNPNTLQGERLSAHARYRRAQAGDESFAPQFVRTRPNLPELMLDALEDDARRASTPPPQLPPNVFIHDDGFYVGRYPDGRLVRWEDADPEAANAYYEEMQKRAELPARTALNMLGGGASFAERGALGASGGRLRQLPLKRQPSPRPVAQAPAQAIPKTEQPVGPPGPPVTAPSPRIEPRGPNAQPLTGQNHHGISKPIYDALKDHNTLKGLYEYRDPRFVTQAIDKDAHRGYQKWHRNLDSEIAERIRDSPDMTPKEFEEYLRARYREPDLIARFPNGL
jgi:hypothetical protein